MGDRDHVPGRYGSGPDARHPNREKTDRAANQERRPDVNVNLTGFPIPGSRRDDESDHDARHPLKEHQPREELVRVAKNSTPVLLEKFFRAFAIRCWNWTG